MKAQLFLAGFCVLAFLNSLLAEEPAGESKANRLVQELQTSDKVSWRRWTPKRVTPS